MTNSEWTIFQTQGARQIWERTTRDHEGNKVTVYRGEELTEMEGEREKVEEYKFFDFQSEALAWLNGEGG